MKTKIKKYGNFIVGKNEITSKVVESKVLNKKAHAKDIKIKKDLENIIIGKVVESILTYRCENDNITKYKKAYKLHKDVFDYQIEISRNVLIKLTSTKDNKIDEYKLDLKEKYSKYLFAVDLEQIGFKIVSKIQLEFDTFSFITSSVYKEDEDVVYINIICKK